MLEKIKNYCFDSNFHFNYQEGKLNIVNYQSIIFLEETRISLKCSQGIVVIRGNNLTVNRLLDQEILVSGEIKTIELG